MLWTSRQYWLEGQGALESRNPGRPSCARSTRQVLMDRHDLQELHYITPIANVPSILSQGLLSHARVAKQQHSSVAMPEVQGRRAKKVVPGGRPLHQYVNLYLTARNPMLYYLRAQHGTLCVLAIDPAVLALPGVVVADANASSEYVRFAAAPGGLSIVDKDMTFAVSWTDPDTLEYYRRKSAKCAEVLVPDQVDPKFILHANVLSVQVREALEAIAPRLPVVVNPNLFFC